MGMAASAAASGSEAPWWNPALVARSSRDVALQVQSKVNSQANSDVAGVVIIPLPPVGAVAVSARYIGYGTFDATDVTGRLTGSFTESGINMGATFATTFSRRLAAGFTLKQLLVSFNCSGECPQLPTSSSVTALDFGSQAFVFRDSSLSIGLTVRNIGPKLQIRDSPQADPLPARGTLGVAYTPNLHDVKDVRVTAAADLVERLAGGSAPGYRFGGELTYLNRLAGRAGYIVHGPGELDGATVGVGFVSERLHID